MSEEKSISNLDYLAAKHSQEIIRRVVEKEETQKNRGQGEKKSKQQLASELDNTVTKALGVLQENGIYACFLYLLAKEKDIGKVVIGEMLNLLEELPFEWRKPADDSTEEVLGYISEKVTADLERLLIAKDTLERMLIYARYGAKARG